MLSVEIPNAKVRAPGLIGISSSTMGRYREFDITLSRVGIPPASSVTWEIGLYLALNYNNLCRKLLAHKDLQWLWILGDDHVFQPDILANLYDRDVDIVVPLCLKRTSPFHPVIYKLSGNKYVQLEWDYLKGKEGLLEVDGAGNAGMLVRRNVIEKIADDWHRVGWQNPEYGASDLYFCKRAKDMGFKIYIDLDNSIGHITHMAIWPFRNKNTEYSASIREALDLPE